MNFLQGHLLIASPYLPDPNFFRSVVLIVNHDDEHAFGLLLNRPGHERLRSVWLQVTGQHSEDDQPVRIGGPLEGPLMILHTVPEFSDADIVPGVFLATQRENVTPLITLNRQPLITVSGYSGWGSGQLERELEVGGWMTMQATQEILFADPQMQWKLAAGQIGDEILAGIVRHAPEDPTWN